MLDRYPFLRCVEADFCACENKGVYLFSQEERNIVNMNENPRCCGVDICNIKLNTGYERVERKWIVVEGEGELRTYHIYEVEVHGI